MTEPLKKEELLASLRAFASAQGITVHHENDVGGIRGEKQAIKVQWFLGGNKSVYSFSCRLDEGAHTATFRESKRCNLASESRSSGGCRTKYLRAPRWQSAHVCGILSR